MTHVEEAGTEPPSGVRTLATRYLAFLAHAFDAQAGRFKNFMSFERHWLEGTGSEDSHGRALWALGSVVGHSADRGRKALSAQLFREALPAVERFTSPRAWAYALLGIDAYVRGSPDGRALEATRDLIAAKLVGRFHESEQSDWPWFENSLTYCNARLPQALMVTAAQTGDVTMAALAERALAWLVTEHVTFDGTFSPIGTNGFYTRGGERALYDQQPVEACAMISACLDAHRVTHHTLWLDHARWAFQWYLGQNPRNAQVYDARTGGCRDGIHADRMNENQGAESTISFLTALAELKAADRVAAKLSRPPAPASVRAPHAPRPFPLALPSHTESAS